MDFDTGLDTLVVVEHLTLFPHKVKVNITGVVIDKADIVLLSAFCLDRCRSPNIGVSLVAKPLGSGFNLFALDCFPCSLRKLA
jgi:hypothetical protein